MTRRELVRAVAERQSLHLRDAEVVVSTLLGAITGALTAGKRVELRGFGTFVPRHRAPRTRRDPRTGATVVVEASVVAHFRTSRELREGLSGVLRGGSAGEGR